jgi:hypothetical protein
MRGWPVRALAIGLVVGACAAGIRFWDGDRVARQRAGAAPTTSGADTPFRPAGIDARVLIIGIDGLGAAQLRGVRLEHMGRLMQEGASTLHARGVLPTVSSPNWASMIMGAPPEFHGITSNEWTGRQPSIPPVAVTSAGRFPSIFGVVRAARPSAVIGVFHQWEDFARLVEPGVADVILHEDTARATTDRAIEFISSRRPTLTFVHLDLVDLEGHESGWSSAEYAQAVQTADALVGRLVAALGDTGIEDQTTVLISSDHGGTGWDHGAMTLGELEIPWIARGRGIARGVVLEGTVSTCDTAPTVAALLGVPVPPAWTGRVVREALSVGAFEQERGAD